MERKECHGIRSFTKPCQPHHCMKTPQCQTAQKNEVQQTRQYGLGFILFNFVSDSTLRKKKRDIFYLIPCANKQFRLFVRYNNVCGKRVSKEYNDNNNK